GETREMAGLSPAERQEQVRQAWREVKLDGFHFLYERHTLSRDGEAYPDPGHYWAEIVRFLNGPEFLGLARSITGVEEIALADAQATLYRPGHFLTTHDDNSPGLNRLAAYVIGFTSAWGPEWGGLLEFIGEDGQISA